MLYIGLFYCTCSGVCILRLEWWLGLVFVLGLLSGSWLGLGLELGLGLG